jgi:hypothetical protein
VSVRSHPLTAFPVDFSSSIWLHGFLVEQHPGPAKLLAEHGEAVGKEAFAHGHEDFLALGERGVDALGLGGTAVLSTESGR